MFSEILTAQDYNAPDQLIRDIIDEDIRRELTSFGQTDFDANKNKKGKSSQEQTLNNLKFNTNDKFKYLQLAEDNMDYDYEVD